MSCPRVARSVAADPQGQGGVGRLHAQADVSRWDEVDRAVSATIRRPRARWVSSSTPRASSTATRAADEMSPPLWERVIAINLTGTFFGRQARAARHAGARGRPHRQHRLGGGRGRLGGRRRLHGVQARRGRSHPAARHHLRRPRSDGERDRSGRHRHRPARELHPHPRRRRAGHARCRRRRGGRASDHAGRPARHPGGNRGRGAASWRQRRGRLHHGPHARGRRRMDSADDHEILTCSTSARSSSRTSASQGTPANAASLHQRAAEPGRSSRRATSRRPWTSSATTPCGRPSTTSSARATRSFPNLIQLSLWLATQTQAAQARLRLQHPAHVASGPPGRGLRDGGHRHRRPRHHGRRPRLSHARGRVVRRAR